MPWWYPLIRAARYLGVAPWALAQQPVAWQDWALMCEAADDNAAAFFQERARQRALEDARMRMN